MRSWVRTSMVAVALLMIGSVAPVARADVLPPLGVPVPPIGAAPTPIGRLDRAHTKPLTFSGGIDNPTPLPLVNLPVPIVCAVTCQQFSFVAGSTAPLLVSVKDTAGSSNNGWDLYVYDPAGGLVGAANGVGANGQAVALPVVVRGTYRIVVTFTYAYDSGAKYAGEVRRMTGASWTPARPVCGKLAGTRGCFRLPRLFAEPATDLHVDGLPPAASTPLGFPFPFAVPTSNSCYVDETVQLGAMRCLRFTSDIKNTGGGRLDLQFTFSGTDCHTEQITENIKGKPATRDAGPCMFHPQHAHFHYKDFVGFSLHALGTNGAIGVRVGSGLKESFCLADDDYFGFGTAGPNGPRTYAGQPGCSLPAGVSGAGVQLNEGLTPGWGDVYTWDTPSQLIDITNVPPGRYALVEKTNPSNNIAVAGPAQTCAVTELTLTATSVAQTRAIQSAPCPP